MTGYTTPTVADAFNRDAADYNALRRQLVPSFDAFYGAALTLIAEWHRAAPRAAPLRVLDLGAGTGLFAGLVLERFADALVTLNDLADGMMAEARVRFADNPAVTFLPGDMTATPLGGPYDLVVSSLAIHHLEHGAKKAVFARIREALAPGGLFVNAEQVLGPNPQAEERYGRWWLNDVRENGVPEDEIERVKARMVHDRCAPLEDQLTWMGEAGLTDVDCCFKVWRFAVLHGEAPGA